jgi:hypothetical protein
LLQRGAVAQGFFGGGVGVVLPLRVLEKLVGRGDRWAAYVATDDTSIKYVLVFQK